MLENQPVRSVSEAALEASVTGIRPLSQVQAGTTVIVKRLTATPELNHRLREMGFGEEQKVRVIRLQSNLLCQVCNSRLGLSSHLAENIWVQPLELTQGPSQLAA